MLPLTPITRRFIESTRPFAAAVGDEVPDEEDAMARSQDGFNGEFVGYCGSRERRKKSGAIGIGGRK